MRNTIFLTVNPVEIDGHRYPRAEPGDGINHGYCLQIMPHGGCDLQQDNPEYTHAGDDDDHR